MGIHLKKKKKKTRPEEVAIQEIFLGPESRGSDPDVTFFLKAKTAAVA